MAKVQNPKLKSVKKSVSEKAKKTQLKKTKAYFPKEKADRTVKNSAKIEVVKEVQHKSADLNKKSKESQEKFRECSPKKKEVEAQVKKTVKETIFKKKNDLRKKEIVEVQDNLIQTTQKKNFTAKVVKKPPLAAKVTKKQFGAKVLTKNKKGGGGIEQKQCENPIEDLKTEAKESTTTVYGPVHFDEEKFKDILRLENIKKVGMALKILVEKEISEKKTSIFSDYRYILNVSNYKIPNCPKRMVKLNLKHSLVDTATTDVVFITADLQRGAKVDYMPTIEHYENLLKEIGLDTIKIVPFNQLRKECQSFEAKRKFANTYDYFLCDGRIVGHVAAFGGKHFHKSRTTLHAVCLANPNKYKTVMEHALKRTSYRQLEKGNLISIPVGNHLFTINQLAENIVEVIKQLETKFPGGYAYIRNIHIKTDIVGTSSLPLYMNLSGAPEEVPNVIGPREQRMLKLKKDANDILSKFNMSKTGDFVKLSTAQANRKRKIREARTALASKENIEADENNGEFSSPLRKKVKQTISQSNTDEDGSEDGGDNTNQDDSEIEDVSDNTNQEERENGDEE